MTKSKNKLENDFFQNWCKRFLEYLDSQENPDFPNKIHRKIWGIEH